MFCKKSFVWGITTQKRFRVDISVFGSFLNRNFGQNRKSVWNWNPNRNSHQNRNFGWNRYQNRKFPISSLNAFNNGKTATHILTDKKLYVTFIFKKQILTNINRLVKIICLMIVSMRGEVNCTNPDYSNWDWSTIVSKIA